MAARPPPRHNILLTLPRTSSHLLTRILNLPAQARIHRHPSDGYFFLAPTVQRFRNHLAGKHVGLWTAEEREDVRDAFQRSYDEVDGFLAEVERQGKASFVKVHVNWLVEPVSETRFLHGAHGVIGVHGEGEVEEAPWTVVLPPGVVVEGDPTRSEGNETALPDQVLRRWRPTFLIRHPALTFPSLLRTSIDNEGLETVLASRATQSWEATFHWSRALYTFYADTTAGAGDEGPETAAHPVVLDADDILDPVLVAKYAESIGLDAACIRYSWDAASEEEMEAMSMVERRMKDTLLGSKGVVSGKTARGLVLGDEVEKWPGEFGDVLAGRLEGFVRSATADYEWLRERRLRV